MKKARSTTKRRPAGQRKKLPQPEPVKAKKFQGLLTLVFSILAVAVTAIGIAVAVPREKSVQLLIVRSGSMAPALPVGSLVVTKRATDYHPGDIVTMQRQDRLVTHRILERQPNGFVTKGDANPAPDTGVVRPDEIIGKVHWVIPWVGRISSFIRTPLGYVVGVLIPALAIVLKEILVIVRELKRGRGKQPPMSGSGGGRRLTTTKQSASRRTPGRALEPVALQSKTKRRRKVLVRPRLAPAGAALSLIFLLSATVLGTQASYSDNATSTNNRFTTAFTEPPTAPNIMIHELLYNSSCSPHDQKQWLELYNGSDTAINLQGWKIHEVTADVTGTIQSRTVLKPGEFMVLARSAGAFSNSCYGRPPAGRIVTDLRCTIPFPTTSGIVQLMNPHGEVIDRVEYGGPGNPSAGIDQSIERRLRGLDTATGDTFAASDFMTRFPITPGFALPNNQTVVLNEFMTKPVPKGFVEIYNASAESIDINRWSIRTTAPLVRIVTLSNATFAPGERKLFAIPHIPARATLYLTDTAGRIMDAFNYHRVPPASGQSWARLPDGTLNWQLDLTPTPNAVNQ